MLSRTMTRLPSRSSSDPLLCIGPQAGTESLGERPVRLSIHSRRHQPTVPCPERPPDAYHQATRICLLARAGLSSSPASDGCDSGVAQSPTRCQPAGFPFFPTGLSFSIRTAAGVQAACHGSQSSCSHHQSPEGKAPGTRSRSVCCTAGLDGRDCPGLGPSSPRSLCGLADLRLQVGWRGRWTLRVPGAIVADMRQEELWDAEAAQRYDTPGTGMFSPEVLGPTVERLAELAGGGRVLEFAIGTGRVAVPLARRGVSVTGIELSPPMVDRLRTKADEATVPVIVGDMTTVVAPGKYALVYLVYNTISNLLTQAAQVGCFRNAARHLNPGGRFVVELWVPELRKLPPGQQATVWHCDAGYIGLDTYDVLRQQIVSHHFRFDENGRTHLFRSPHRYIWPAELDLMGQLAGFELEARHADWTGTEFTAESRSHVSVFRIPSRS
jgi:SAM-dependent methyltransferase